MDQALANLGRSYDDVSEEYADRIFTELEHKPLDRELLDRFAARIQRGGVVCDLGCGPGQIARYLHDRGVSVVGVDLSPGMIQVARRLNPGIEFFQDNMMSLRVADDAWAGIAAFYSIIHIPRPMVVGTLRELRRVLQPGGLLLISFHKGDRVIHTEEWWGKPVNVDAFFFERHEMERYLVSAAFDIEEVTERPPYKDFEYESHRVYILARKAASTGSS